MRSYAFLGYDPHFGLCECCGREELKRTVKLRGPNGVVRYGTGCAARALGLTGKEVTQRATAAQKAVDEVAEVARQAAVAAEHARWVAHLVARTGGIYTSERQPNVFAMIKALGGMAEAQKGYRR